MPDFTTSDGARMQYQDEGEGRPVVLIPGICGGARWWATNERR